MWIVAKAIEVFSGLVSVALTKLAGMRVASLTAITSFNALGLAIVGIAVVLKLMHEAAAKSSPQLRMFANTLDEAVESGDKYADLLKTTTSSIPKLKDELDGVRSRLEEIAQLTGADRIVEIVREQEELYKQRDQLVSTIAGLERTEDTAIKVISAKIIELEGLRNEIYEYTGTSILGNIFDEDASRLLGIFTEELRQLDIIEARLDEYTRARNEATFKIDVETASDTNIISRYGFDIYEEQLELRRQQEQSVRDANLEEERRAAQELEDMRREALETWREDETKAISDIFGMFRGELTASTDRVRDFDAATRAAWQGNEQGFAVLIGMQDAYTALGMTQDDATAKVLQLFSAIESLDRNAVVQLVQEFLNVKSAADSTAAGIEAADEAAAEMAEERAEQLRELSNMFASLSDMSAMTFQAAHVAPYINALENLNGVSQSQLDVFRHMAEEIEGLNWQSMEQDALKYGVAINETKTALLGAAYAQARVDDEGRQMAQAWNNLVGHGVKVRIAIAGMKDEAQDFVKQALTMGTKLPRSMEPMLRSMVHMGALTDENGERLEDLSRIRFSDALEQQIDALVNAMWSLVEQLGGNIPEAVRRARNDIDNLIPSIDLIGSTAQLSAEELAALEQNAQGVGTASDDTASEVSGMEGALQGLASAVTGTTTKAINLTLSMLEQRRAIRDNNTELSETALNAKYAEAGLSGARVASAGFASVLGVLGDNIGGVKGDLMSLAAGIAEGFAQGGLIGGIIAGIAGLIGAIFKWTATSQDVIDANEALMSSFEDVRSGALDVEDALDKAINWEGNAEGFDFLRSVQKDFREAGRTTEEATKLVDAYWAAMRREDIGSMERAAEAMLEVAAQARLARIEIELIGGLPQEEIDKLDEYSQVWAGLTLEDQVLGLDRYIEKLREAREAGYELNEEQRTFLDGVERVVGLASAAETLGLIKIIDPEEARQFAYMTELWGQLDESQKAAHAGQYAEYLRLAAESGMQLTEAQQAFLDDHPDWEAMEAVAEKYGISLDAMGSKFHAMKAIDFGRALASEFELLVGGGANVVAVLGTLTQTIIEDGKEVEIAGTGMADSVNAYFQAVLANGAAVPESMRPVLEAMIEQGLLLDANGEKIKDLAGIEFKPEPIQAIAVAVDGVVIAMAALLEGLGIEVPEALASMAEAATESWQQMHDSTKTAGELIGELGDDITGLTEEELKNLRIVLAEDTSWEDWTGLAKEELEVKLAEALQALQDGPLKDLQDGIATDESWNAWYTSAEAALGEDGALELLEHIVTAITGDSGLIPTINSAEGPTTSLGDLMRDKFGAAKDKVEGIVGAINRIPSSVETNVRVNHHTDYTRTNYDPFIAPPGTFPGAAAGGLFTKPAFRVVAERGPEIVGSPEPLVDAFLKALDKHGGSTVGGGGGNRIIVVTPDQLRSGDVDGLSRDDVDSIQEALDSGQLRIPERAIGRRVR